MAESIHIKELNKGIRETVKGLREVTIKLTPLEEALPEVTQGIGKLEHGAEEAGSTLAESGKRFTKPEDGGEAGTSRLAGGISKAALDNLVKSGMWSTIGRTTSAAAEAGFSSLLGDTAGSMASHIVSDAGTGLMFGLLNATAAGGGIAASAATAAGGIAGAMGGLGSVLGGPVGGLVVGALFGVAEGIVESFEKQDQAFQDYVKSQYDRVMQEQQAMLQRGTTLAAAGDEEYQPAMRGLEEAQNELEKLMGQGFIDTRKDGIQAQKEWLEEQTKQKEEGETGLGLGDAYGLIGSFQASLENDKERLERDALSIVMGDGEKISSYQDSAQRERLEELQAQYQALEEQYGATDSEEMQRKIGAKMGALLAEAQIIAANEYNASEGAQLMQESNLALVQGIRDDSVLQKEYYNAGYTMGEEFSQGILAARMENAFSPVDYGLAPEEGGTGIGSATSEPENNAIPSAYKVKADSGIHGRYAYGLHTVPYDNFPALLHQGERVLTASQARSADRGGGVSVTFSGPVTVREEADLDRLAAKLAEKVARAALLRG